MMASLPPHESFESPSQTAVLGLDNIPIDLPVAGVGSRVLASFIDHLLLFLVYFGMVGIGVIVLPTIGVAGGWMIALLIFLFFLLQWGVFALVEIITVGRTPGKAAVKLRVVTIQGGRPSVAALLMRNLLRSIDYIVGIPLIAFDPQARRLGDRLAGTLVVHDRVVGHENVIRRLPHTWGAREAAFVEAFAMRCREMEPLRAAEMAKRLLAAAEQAETGFTSEARTYADPVMAVLKAFWVSRK